MVPRAGLEPARDKFPQDFKSCASTDFATKAYQYFLNGAQTRNRTTDTGIFSPLLYRLSYLGKNGGSDETRTRDILRDRQAL